MNGNYTTEPDGGNDFFDGNMYQDIREASVRQENLLYYTLIVENPGFPVENVNLAAYNRGRILYEAQQARQRDPLFRIRQNSVRQKVEDEDEEKLDWPKIPGFRD